MAAADWKFSVDYKLRRETKKVHIGVFFFLRTKNAAGVSDRCLIVAP